MKYIKYSFLLIFLHFWLLVFAHGQTRLNLSDAIRLAQEQSPDAMMAKHRYKSSYWEFRTYKAQFRPSLNLNTNLIDFNHSISRSRNDDGSYSFLEDNINTSSATLSLNQNLSFSGGNVFISSALNRVDVLGDSSITSYLTSPISIGIKQPLSFYNPFAWERKIEPMRYEVAKKQYVSNLENISAKAVGYFFDQILAQINLDIARANYSNNDTIFKIAQGRYNVGTIARNDLLQIELQLLNSKAELNRVKIELEMAKSKFTSFLGFNDKMDIELEISSEIPKFNIDYQKAKDLALKNNPDIISQNIGLLQAEQNVRKAKSENLFSSNLYASYGLTRSALNISEAYKDPIKNQQFTIGIEIPILDWGLGKGRYQMAKSSLELEKVNVQQALNDFEQSVYLTAARFNMQGEQLEIAAKADTIAQLRYEVTKQRFLVGKIDALDLNIASTEKDVARRGFIAALRNYWEQYYAIRKITLYDFEKETDLQTSLPGLLNP